MAEPVTIKVGPRQYIRVSASRPAPWGEREVVVESFELDEDKRECDHEPTSFKATEAIKISAAMLACATEIL